MRLSSDLAFSCPDDDDEAYINFTHSQSVFLCGIVGCPVYIQSLLLCVSSLYYVFKFFYICPVFLCFSLQHIPVRCPQTFPFFVIGHMLQKHILLACKIATNFVTFSHCE